MSCRQKNGSKSAKTRKVRSPSQAGIKKVHLHYLYILQKYYDGKYGEVAKEFFTVFGNEGQRVRSPEDERIFQDFIQERNRLFQGSRFVQLEQLLKGRNLDLNELYLLTAKHQQEMQDALESLKSMF